MKKFTLIVAMLFCVAGFSQEIEVKNLGPNNPTYPSKAVANKQMKVDKASSESNSTYSSFTEMPAEAIAGVARRAAVAAVKISSQVVPSRTTSDDLVATVNSSSQVVQSRTTSDDPVVAALLERLSNLESQSGSLYEHFSVQEVTLLTNHFAGKESKIFDTSARSSAPVGSNSFSASGTVNGDRIVTPVAQTRNPGILITHSATQNILPGNSVTCNAAGIPTLQSFFRAFDLAGDFGITGDFIVSDVEFGVETVSGPVGLTLNVWSSSGAAFPNGTLTLQGSATYTSDVADTETVVSVPVAATIPAGDEMIFELQIDDLAANSWFPGSNSDGQTDVSYILADACGITAPTDLAAIGFPGQHMVMNVIGKDGTGGGGGGGPCDQANASNAFENGRGCSANNNWTAANDFIVPAGEDASLTAISPNIFMAVGATLVSADITIYDDAGGVPGTMIDQQLGVAPTSQAVIGSNFGLDISTVDFDLTPVDLPGDAGADTPYWIAIQVTPSDGGTAFWEDNSVNITGEFLAFNDGSGWTIPDVRDGVYTFFADCTPIGGGGGGCTTGVFTARADFETAFGGALIDEDFESTLGVDICSDPVPISSAGNACFAAGDVVDGVEVFSDPTGESVTLQAGGPFGNTANLVGANTFTDATTISFPAGDVDSFGVDIYLPLAASDTDVTIEAFGASGLLESTTVLVPAGPNAGAFVGIIAAEPILEVFVTAANDEGELIADLSFGSCDGGGGGGGGNDCSLVGPGNGFENGKSCSQPLGRIVAHDIEVPADQNMMLEVISANMFIGATGSGVNADLVDIYIWGDNGGQPDPGNVIATVPGFVPTNQTVVGSNFGFDVWNVELDHPDVMLDGQAGAATTYWIGLSVAATDGSNVFWENSTAGLIGNGEAYNDGSGTFVIDSTLEGVYTFTAACEDLIIVTYDDCEGALPIGCGDSVLGDTIGATDDSGVAPDCDTPTTTPGVWYKFEDTSGLVADITLTTCSANTDYDTKISVYTGECGNPPLTCVAGNDDDPNCPDFQSSVEFTSDGNTTYYILVHGFGGQTGNFELTMTCDFIPPPNDDIENAIDLDEVGCPFTDEDVAMPAATEEDGTPTDCDITGANGVWYVFTPELDGQITGTIATPGGAPGTNLIVNNGPLAGDYAPVAAGFGGAIPTSPLTEDAVVVIDADTTGDPNDACDPIDNGADLSGKIAVLRRGACEFGLKALAAQNEGAIAVVVVNNQPGDPIVMGGGEFGEQVIIPVVMISDVEGEPIITELLAGNTVNMTLFSDPATVSSITFYTAPDESSTEDELVLVDWYQNQCLPSETATIPVDAGQTYYCFVVNSGAVTDIIFDNCQLGVNSNEIEGFVFYPNPTNDRLNLSATQNIESVALYNILGQKVIEMNVDAMQTQVGVSHLASGAYIMEVMVDGQKGTYKVIKN